METENVGVCVYCSAEKSLDDLLTTGRGNLACNDPSCTWCCAECEECFTLNRTSYDVQGSSKKYCRTCLNDGDYRMCYHCDEWMTLDDSCYIESYSRSVCDGCRDYNYSWCERCDDYSIGRHDHGSEFVHSYGDCPTWIVKRVDEDDTSKVLMGIEIETGYSSSFSSDESLGGHASHIVGKWGENELYITEDGSVNGFEVKTHPMTLSYTKEVHDWSWLSYLKDGGHGGWDETDAGIHIHVDREAFDGSSHLMKFLMFIYGNSLDVAIFAGRVSSYASFADRSNLRRKAHTNTKRISDDFNLARNVWERSDRDSYGSFPADMIRFPEFMDRVKTIASDRGRSVEWMMSQINEFATFYPGTGNRSSAVNVTKTGDIEVRIFRSSLRKERVLAIFEFVHSVIEFTRPLSTRDLILGSLKWDVYLEFMRRNDSLYDNFARNIFAWNMEGVFHRAEGELIDLLNQRSKYYGDVPQVRGKSEFNREAFKTHALTIDVDYYVTSDTEAGF